MKNKIEDMISGYIENDISQEEKNIIEEYMDKNPDFLSKVNSIKDMMLLLKKTPTLEPSNNFLSNLEERIAKEKKSIFNFSYNFKMGIAFASSLDQIGPITKNVQDSAIVLNAISGYDPKDSTSIKNVSQDYISNLKSNISGMKLGVPKEYFPDGMEEGVKKSVFQAIEQFKKLGVEIKEVSLPHTDYALAVYYIIAPSEAAANLARYDGVKYGFSSKGDLEDIFDDIETTRQGGFGDEVKRRIMIGTYALSAGYYDAYYIKAQKIRTIIREEFNQVFKDVDALITPTSPSTAFKLGEKTSDPMAMYSSDIMTIPANIAGIPGISIPVKDVNGLPVGAQLVGPYMSDRKILEISKNIQKLTDWHMNSAIID